MASIMWLPVVFAVCSSILYSLSMSLPALPEEGLTVNSTALKFPSNLDELRDLATLLEHYRSNHLPYVLMLYSTAYIFKQAFAIPGSIFLNLLGGALFGQWVGFFLTCILSASGATCCFLLAKVCGRSYILKYFPDKLQFIQSKIQANSDSLFFFLMFLRLFPMTPNWFLNMASPICGVPTHLFFLSVFFGLMPYNFISVQTGCLLSQLTSMDKVFTPWTMLKLFAMATAALVPGLLIKKYQEARTEKKRKLEAEKAAEIKAEEAAEQAQWPSPKARKRLAFQNRTKSADHKDVEIDVDFYNSLVDEYYAVRERKLKTQLESVVEDDPGSSSKQESDHELLAQEIGEESDSIEEIVPDKILEASDSDIEIIPDEEPVEEVVAESAKTEIEDLTFTEKVDTNKESEVPASPTELDNGEIEIIKPESEDESTAEEQGQEAVTCTETLTAQEEAVASEEMRVCTNNDIMDAEQSNQAEPATESVTLETEVSERPCVDADLSTKTQCSLNKKNNKANKPEDTSNILSDKPAVADTASMLPSELYPAEATEEKMSAFDLKVQTGEVDESLVKALEVSEEAKLDERRTTETMDNVPGDGLDTEDTINVKLNMHIKVDAEEHDSSDNTQYTTSDNTTANTKDTQDSRDGTKIENDSNENLPNEMKSETKAASTEYSADANASESNTDTATVDIESESSKDSESMQTGELMNEKAEGGEMDICKSDGDKTKSEVESAEDAPYDPPPIATPAHSGEQPESTATLKSGTGSK